MKPVVIRERREIERFLRRSPFLHLYEIGDLDDLYFDHTTWYGLREGDEILALALLYTGTAMPVLLALADEPNASIYGLLREVVPTLPERFYAHLSPGIVDAFSESHRIESHGSFLKMALTEPALLDGIDTSDVRALAVDDLDDLEAFYGAAYPGHWFEPGMLVAGHYYGLRWDGELMSVAGVHVFSRRCRVAALGNIATHPRARGKGLARLVTARLCQELLGAADHIGLNVKDDNSSAIACYERLGFRPFAPYGEYTLWRRTPSNPLH